MDRNSKKISLKKSGFTIVELIITIFILSFGIVSVYGAFAGVINTANTISSRFTAVYLAKEGMEIIKNIRDDNFVNGRSWDSGFIDCSSGCQADYKTGTAQEASANQLQAYSDSNFLKINNDGLYGYDAGTATIFKRKITITTVSTDQLSVNVKIYWNYNGKPFTFETEEYLYNWH